MFKEGDFVEIKYIGRIVESNEIFDLTDEEVAKKNKIYNPRAKYGPISIVIGANQILTSLEEEIRKMDVNEKKTVTLEAKKAFGERHAQLVRIFNETELRKRGVTPIPGHYLNFGQMNGRVLSVAGGRVRIDFNHPLAGKNVVYEVEVSNHWTKDEDKIKAIVTFNSGLNKDEVEAKIANKKVEIVLPMMNNIPGENKQKMFESITKHLNIDELQFIEKFRKAAENKNKNQEQQEETKV